jgi:hypothetical protein
MEICIVRGVTIKFPECPRKKLYLITYTLMVAVTFEVVSLRTNTLIESVFPLPLLRFYCLICFTNTKCNHRHVVTHCCVVIAHSLLATYRWAFWELNCHTLYFRTVLHHSTLNSCWRNLPHAYNLYSSC